MKNSEKLTVLLTNSEAVFSREALAFGALCLLCFVLSLGLSFVHPGQSPVLVCALAALGTVAAGAAFALAKSARHAHSWRLLHAKRKEETEALERQLQDTQALLAVQTGRLQASEARLETMTTIDTVTQLQNHGSFQERLRAELRQSRLGRSSLSLLRVNIDGFKRYNETYGHAAGDAVLTELAATLSEHLRESDFAARYGGDDFVVLLPDTDYLGALEAAERLRAAVEAAPWEYRAITIGIGGSTLSSSARRRSDLLAQAESALRYAKTSGTNQVCHCCDLPAKLSVVTQSKTTAPLSVAA